MKDFLITLAFVAIIFTACLACLWAAHWMGYGTQHPETIRCNYWRAV